MNRPPVSSLPTIDPSRQLDSETGTERDLDLPHVAEEEEEGSLLPIPKSSSANQSARPERNAVEATSWEWRVVTRRREIEVWIHLYVFRQGWIREGGGRRRRPSVRYLGTGSRTNGSFHRAPRKRTRNERGYRRERRYHPLFESIHDPFHQEHVRRCKIDSSFLFRERVPTFRTRRRRRRIQRHRCWKVSNILASPCLGFDSVESIRTERIEMSMGTSFGSSVPKPSNRMKAHGFHRRKSMERTSRSSQGIGLKSSCT